MHKEGTRLHFVPLKQKSLPRNWTETQNVNQQGCKSFCWHPNQRGFIFSKLLFMVSWDCFSLLCRSGGGVGVWIGKINWGGKSSSGNKDRSVLTVNIWRLDLIPFHVVVPPKHFSEYNNTPTSWKFLTFYSTFTTAVDKLQSIDEN